MQVSPVRKKCALSFNRILFGASSLETEIRELRKTLSQSAGKTATFLLKGAVERSETIRAILKKLSKTPLSKLEPEIKSILFLGIYELLFSETESYAVLNEYVGLSKELKKASASGFVNAVLRSAQRDGEALLSSLRISEQLSLPEPVWKAFSEDYSVEEIKKMGAYFLSPEAKRLTVRRNQSKCGEEELKAMLSEEGAELLPVTLFEGGTSEDVYVLRSETPMESLSAYQKGLFYVQDLSSSLAGDALKDLFGREKQKFAVLDVSASPGGKSLHLYDMALKTGNFVEITACDISAERLAPLIENISRFGFDKIRPTVQDGTRFTQKFENMFDVVLADVPCSGLGCLSGRPDIRLRTTEESLKEITGLQQAILENAARYVKPGGTLLYSTCTVRKAENEAQTEALLRTHPEFFSVYEKTYLPGITTTGDGFYIRRLEKRTDEDSDKS